MLGRPRARALVSTDVADKEELCLRGGEGVTHGSIPVRYTDRRILLENLCGMVTAGLLHDSNEGAVEPRKRAVKDLE